MANVKVKYQGTQATAEKAVCTDFGQFTYGQVVEVSEEKAAAMVRVPGFSIVQETPKKEAKKAKKREVKP